MRIYLSAGHGIKDHEVCWCNWKNRARFGVLSLTHLDKKDNYVRILIVDFSSRQLYSNWFEWHSSGTGTKLLSEAVTLLVGNGL